MTAYGDVISTRLRPAVLTSPWDSVEGVERCRCAWLPPTGLQLPDKYLIKFHCYSDGRGTRRFVPVGGFQTFILKAALAGLAILQRERQLTPEQTASYRAMFLLFQLVRRWQEHLGRNFTSPQDLVVRRTGRGGDIGATVLPGRVDGSPQSVDSFMARGRAAATQDSVVHCNSRLAIRYSFEEEANQRSVHLQPAEVRLVIRMALFDLTDFEIPSVWMMDEITERLLRALEVHGDDDQEAFQRWFMPGKSNLVKTIADQAGRPEGKVDHSMVRSAVLELGWRSYEYVAGCHDAFGRWFELSLQPSLNKTEQQVFKAMYRPQRYLASLPLVLLLERQSLISGMITQLWTTPGDMELIGTLHQLLQMYSDMVSIRRSADRHSKQRGRKGNRNATSEATNLDDNVHASSLMSPQMRFDRLAKAIAARERLECACGSWGWQLAYSHFDSSAGEFTIDVCCICNLVERRVTFTHAELNDLDVPASAN